MIGDDPDAKLKTVVDRRGVITYWDYDDYPLFAVSGAFWATGYLNLPKFDITGNWTGNNFYVPNEISASTYLGIKVGATSSGYTNIASYDQTRTIHEPTIGASRAGTQPGQGPTPIAINTTLGLQFTPNNATSRAYRTFKIPTSYVGDAAFHVHWTKSGNQNETGKYVRWHISYTVFNGLSQDISAATGSINVYVEDTYDDSGTTTRVTYRTPNASMSGFVPGYYVSMYVDAETPVSGTIMASEPVLISLDLTYTAYINQ